MKYDLLTDEVQAPTFTVVAFESIAPLTGIHLAFATLKGGKRGEEENQ